MIDRFKSHVAEVRINGGESLDNEKSDVLPST